MWLLGILIGPSLTGVLSSAVQVLAILWLTGVGLILGGVKFLFPPVFRQYPSAPITLGVFLLATLPGSLFSLSPGTSLGLWATTLVTVVTCAGLWSFLSPTDFGYGLKLYALVGLPVLGLILLPGYTIDVELLLANVASERLDYMRNPNSIGMILMGMILCVFMIQNKGIKAVLFPLGGIVLFLTLSRSSILGTVLAVSILALFQWRTLKHTHRLALSISGFLCIVVVVALYGKHVIELLDLLTGFSDPDRGWGSFTFRAKAWRETIDLWVQYPLLGVGYRMHEPYITSLSSAHNGYLALLAETGLLGAIPMVVFLVSSSLRVLRSALHGLRVAQVGFALLCGMAFISFFERTLINFGNPTSIIHLMILLMPWSGAYRKRILPHPPALQKQKVS